MIPWRMLLVFLPLLYDLESLKSLEFYAIIGFVHVLKSEVAAIKKVNGRKWLRILQTVVMISAAFGGAKYMEWDTKFFVGWIFSFLIAPIAQHLFPVWGKTLTTASMVLILVGSWLILGIGSTFLSLFWLHGVMMMQRAVCLSTTKHVLLVLGLLVLWSPYISLGAVTLTDPEQLEVFLQHRWVLKYMCAAANMPMNADHYATLGLSTSVTNRAVTKRYRELALQFHPDKLPKSMGVEEKDAAVTYFASIADAHHVLSHPAGRKKYDQQHQMMEMEALLPMCVSLCVILFVWFMHCIADHKEWVTQESLKDYVLSGKPLNLRALGLESRKDLVEFVKDGSNDLPDCSANNTQCIRALYAGMFNAGYNTRMRPMPLEMTEEEKLFTETDIILTDDEMDRQDLRPFLGQLLRGWVVNMNVPFTMKALMRVFEGLPADGALIFNQEHITAKSILQVGVTEDGQYKILQLGTVHDVIWVNAPPTAPSEKVFITAISDTPAGSENPSIVTLDNGLMFLNPVSRLRLKSTGMHIAAVPERLIRELMDEPYFMQVKEHVANELEKLKGASSSPKAVASSPAAAGAKKRNSGGKGSTGD